MRRFLKAFDRTVNWPVALLLALVIGAIAVAGAPPKPHDAVAVAPPAKSDAPVAAKADDGIPAGHKVLYAAARTKAIGQLAKKEGISRAAAREKIDDISDEALHAAVVASGAIPVKALPTGGKLTDFLDWLIQHQDQILAIVKILLAFFAAMIDVANSDAFAAHDWCGQMFAMAA